MKQTRSTEKELMDLGKEHYSDEEFHDCLAKLYKVNLFLGIYKDTLSRIRKSSPAPETVVDIGCGGGEFMIALAKQCPSSNFIGMDINPEAIRYANKRLEEAKTPNVRFELQNEAHPLFADTTIDVILATLVCHHISDEALVVFLKTLYKACKKMLIINDLERSQLAYWLYQLLSPMLFNNRLITHDGLISIQKGFTRQEWRTLIKEACIPESAVRLKWCFPFRWQLVFTKDAKDA